MFRLYVERKPGFENEAKTYFSQFKNFLGISGLTGVRYLNRYDVENIDLSVGKAAAVRIFSEPQSDFVFFEKPEITSDSAVVIWEYLPGQYDQRADSAEQCLNLLQAELNQSADESKNLPVVRSAKMVILEGKLSLDDVSKIRNYLVNPVDSRLADEKIPETLKIEAEEPCDIPAVEGFIKFSAEELEAYRTGSALAMDAADIKFLQDYFIEEGRDPTETEIRVIDTYWSDHCRHTTFLTELKEIKIEEGPYSSLFEKSLRNYNSMRNEIYGNRTEKPFCLMDMAVIGMKYLKKHGKLEDLEVSEENNACSVFINVHCTSGADGKPSDYNERWLMMFKNETHNHPTEIEPFGGAATCIGGAIRDPLSGRSWVYQAMRVTGASDPTTPLSETRKGKLPQLKICREAAHGFSAYGNQIGLSTGQVTEFYHPGYEAKRMELGAVIAAAPADTVVRERPEAGDIVLLLGGGTGRDGIGGATGSSKVHTEKSVTSAAAEVQKGNAVEERKIQRLFRKKDVSLMIRRCNDFGAGGVAVAIGELAPGLLINLDAVPKKYDGLNGTELAISESQERMAVVVRECDAEKFIAEAAKENLLAVKVADVTDSERLVMKWRGKTIVDIARKFLDAAGAHHEACAFIESPENREVSPLVNALDSVKNVLSLEKEKEILKKAWLFNMNDLAVCSQRGLSERFDGSIGSSTVLFPFGGKYQATPEAGMCAKIPVQSPFETSTVSIMAHGFDPRVGKWSPWHGSQVAVLSSLAKIACMGGNTENVRFSFQEFFGRATDERRWGYPAAALLGALDAQIATGCASIGGKDSMSGSFEELDVPHTLVSFAAAYDDVSKITSGSFKSAGHNVYLVSVPYSEELAPDFASFMKNSRQLYSLNAEGKIAAMYPVGAGGIAEAVTKMAFGNRIGIKIENIPYSATKIGENQKHSSSEHDFFTPLYGSIIVEANQKLSASDFEDGTFFILGKTISEPEIFVSVAGIEECRIPLFEAEESWEGRLKSVFPPVSSFSQEEKLPDFAKKIHSSLSEIRKNPVFVNSGAKPRVVIPVFPGTNCEFDMARAFDLAGAETRILVLANRTPEMLSRSLSEFSKELKDANILALAGGFSAGDEPDGSAKFIANCLRESRIADEIMNLLKKRDGLVLGICNGFQALVKTGLAIYGEIRDMKSDMPTLTYNRIGRHVSRIVRTRMVSASSPWALDPSVVDLRVHLVPVSHGEGRFVCDGATAERLFENGQVFSQYADEFGNPTLSEPDNPNGSCYAIEGLTSPDGRVLGKMGHSERTLGKALNGASPDLVKNVAGNPLLNEYENSCQNIFAAGVRYFK